MYSKLFQDTADAKNLWKMTYRTSATCVDSAPDMPMYSLDKNTDTCYAFLSSSSYKVVLGQIPAGSSATSASIGIVAAGLAVAAAAVIV